MVNFRPRNFSQVKDANSVKDANFEEVKTDDVGTAPEADDTTPPELNEEFFKNLDDMPDVDEIERTDETEPDQHIDVGKESRKGSGEKKTFQAETRKLLDIVANSLYTDREVFLRELISNASDALEKGRYLQKTNQAIRDDKHPFEIRIYTNEKERTLIIQDSGIGMDEEEIVENLGTIARSGSKTFSELAKKNPGQDAGNIIGQFGVGFYSVFMVSENVEVYSLCAREDSTKEAVYWQSDGSGDYELGGAENCSRGTKIKIFLKDGAKEFSVKHVVEGIIKKYSNFVAFPIYLNDSKINTVGAIWAQDQKSVTDEMHNDFYRFVSNSYDKPLDRMHFKTDAPIDINALFYFPSRHMEKYGMGRLDPGVSLYSRKVLIQHNSKLILPEWCRFVKGVVDSEDIPLNISRENMQDSALIKRMNNVLTKRIIKHLDSMSKKDAAKFIEFYREFSSFIKEGVCSDAVNKDEIARLLRYDTSVDDKEQSSLDDYIGRMPPEQQDIFYLYAPNRKYALLSPYFESFDQAGTEVIFIYGHIDDFVMKNLAKYNSRKLVSIESAKAKPADKAKDEPEKTEAEKKQEEIDAKNADALCTYLRDTLDKLVSSVTSTSRLRDSPAIVVDHESATVRKMMQYVDAAGHQSELPKQKLQINPKHPVMQRLIKLKGSNPELASLVAHQVFDNALIAADIMENPRGMLARLNDILYAAAGADSASSQTTEESTPEPEAEVQEAK